MNNSDGYSKPSIMENGMFSIITDGNGNPISKEEFERMNRECLVLLLQGYIKKMTYIRKEDKIALSFLADSLLHNFKDNKK